MPLEITLLFPGVVIRTVDGDKSMEVLADFGPLVVTASYGTPKGKYDPIEYPFSITHRASGLLVDCYPSLDLASCAARQWCRYDWSITVNDKQSPATEEDQRKTGELARLMKATAIYSFGARHKKAV